MLSTKDVAVVYETLLMSPGMTDVVKLTLSIPRKNVLLLAKVTELGIIMKDDPQAGLLNAVSKESLDELISLTAELLQKAGLTDVYFKLSTFQQK